MIMMPLMPLARATGALLFAIALASTAYVLVRLWPAAAAVTGPALAAALVRNALLFALFALHHSLFARPAVKRWLRTRLDDGGQRTLYVWAASLLLLLTTWMWRPVGHVLYTVPSWLSPFMVALQSAGGLCILFAARVIDPLELAGLRTPTADRLDLKGPYRLVRHPIYLGFLLVVWGAATMTGDRAWFAALSTLYLLIAIPLEEGAMRRSLGARYAAYRAQVRWRVVPGLY